MTTIATAPNWTWMVSPIVGVLCFLAGRWWALRDKRDARLDGIAGNYIKEFRDAGEPSDPNHRLWIFQRCGVLSLTEGQVEIVRERIRSHGHSDPISGGWTKLGMLPFLRWVRDHNVDLRDDPSWFGQWLEQSLFGTEPPKVPIAAELTKGRDQPIT